MHNTTQPNPEVAENEAPEIDPFFQTATNIGRKLAKEALWTTDGRCNWQGASVETVQQQYKMVQRTFKSDIYHGLSGIALFLSELAQHLEDPVIVHTLKGTIQTIIWQAENTESTNKYGFFSGDLGVGYALWKIGLDLNNETWYQTGLNLIRSVCNSPIAVHEVDIISGAAGAIPALLAIYAHEKEELFLTTARACGDFLIQYATPAGTESVSWNTIPNTPGLTGYSHGAAGMALALLELHHITKEERYKTTALKGFQYEREQFIPQQNNWPDLRKPFNHPMEASCGEMWCHGAPGIALSRIRAYALTEAPEFAQEAHVALQTTYQAVVNELSQPTTANYSLCHGLAGNAAILLTAGLTYQHAPFIQAARRAGLTGIELYDEPALDWPSGVNDPGATGHSNSTPGLMLGLAGTGHFYLQLAFPQEVKSLLLI